MNYCENKKQQIKYCSKITALVLTGLPVGINLLRGKTPPWANPEWKAASPSEKALVIGGLIVLGMITYYAYYYTLSSLFWPESLSIMNWMLLVPCGVLSFLNGRDVGELVLKLNQKNNI